MIERALIFSTCAEQGLWSSFQLLLWCHNWATQVHKAFSLFSLLSTIRQKGAIKATKRKAIIPEGKLALESCCQPAWFLIEKYLFPLLRSLWASPPFVPPCAHCNVTKRLCVLAGLNHRLWYSLNIRLILESCFFSWFYWCVRLGNKTGWKRGMKEGTC